MKRVEMDHLCVEGTGHESDDKAARCHRQFRWDGEVRRFGKFPAAYLSC